MQVVVLNLECSTSTKQGKWEATGKAGQGRRGKSSGKSANQARIASEGDGSRKPSKEGEQWVVSCS